jgi:5'(3')-deoxyribonucleotidase
MKCFLDMDGVLADFVGGVSAAHKLQSPYENENLGISRFGVFDMEKLWGMSAEKFWEPTNNSGFWAFLSETPEAVQLVRLVNDIFGQENIAILTSPSQHEGCFKGKKEWIRKHFPQFNKNIIFGSAKEFMASPDRVLVDDRDKNIDGFEAAGGHGVLVPRAWNREWGLRDNTWEVVKERLEKFRGRK